METLVSNTGKHGHEKAGLVGIDLSIGTKCQENHPAYRYVDVLSVQRKQYRLLDVNDDGFVSPMSTDGDIRTDLKVSEGEVRNKIEKLFRTEKKEILVIILTAMGQEEVIEADEASKAA